MISCTCWNVTANVKTGVNYEFKFNPYKPTKPFTFLDFIKVKIPQGAYKITDLNKTIKELITENKGNADDFELAPNYNTLLA